MKSARPKALMIAATHSGAGKTTIVAALIAALVKRGLKVQAFKVGPDFIDPAYHTFLSGCQAYNLDSFLMGQAACQDLFYELAAQADISIVEGVMGLYDGPDPLTDEGSAAQMAKWLNLPVMLVADAKGLGRSLAALVKGFAEIDPKLNLAGVLANRVGSARHFELMEGALKAAKGPKLWGGLANEPQIRVGERNLGLLTPEEAGFDDEKREILAHWLESSLNLSEILEALPALNIGSLKAEIAPPLPPVNNSKPVLAVPKDAAFNFYYQPNLEALSRAGFEISFFSSLKDANLPKDAKAVYWGGGRPEYWARELSQNKELWANLRGFAEKGGFIWAEGGAVAIFGETLNLANGEIWPLAKVLAFKTQQKKRLAALGYRYLNLNPAIFNLESPVKGHEFRYLDFETPEARPFLWLAQDRGGDDLGYRGWADNNVWLSPAHVYLPSNPQLADLFVRRARWHS